jgi:hypothetical protein
MYQTSVFCPTCNQMRLYTAPEMNHTAHILASVFLCGLWLPVWIGAAALNNPIYRCQTCGFGMTADQIRKSRNPMQNSLPPGFVPVSTLSIEPVKVVEPVEPVVEKPKPKPIKLSEVKRPSIRINRNDSDKDL